ncbi:MAG: hypothetical protein AAFN77_06100 [Planctomycetota bacterium]
MIRKSLIVLSLCCAVLCAFIGYMSQRAIEESERVSTSSFDLDCERLLDQAPVASTEIVLSDFIVGKKFATMDIDGDYQWDVTGVLLFPKKKQSTRYGYRAVIVSCKGIPDEATLNEKLLSEPESLTVDFWPTRELEPSIHSQLAMKYRNLDFARSRVVYLGYERENPILGETTLKLSIVVGGASVAVAVLTIIISLIIGMLSRLFKRSPKPNAPQPTANRAGLPASGSLDHEPTGGVLDRVRSRRDQQPGT